jgi:hypothetical protein
LDELSYLLSLELVKAALLLFLVASALLLTRVLRP